MKLCDRCKEQMREEKRQQRGAVQCQAQTPFGGQCRRPTTYPNQSGRCYFHGGQNGPVPRNP